MRELTQSDLERIQMLTSDRVGIDTLERYTGSQIDQFQPYILLTNFPDYVQVFSEMFHQPIMRGSAMTACHAKDEQISIVHFGIGSPLAALIAELLSFVKPKATLMLGLCGGLRKEYEVGEFFNPIAAIREEGTSNAYLPPRCPSLSSFVIQRYVCSELEKENMKYHTGVIHTTNVRFWEFKKDFVNELSIERSQAIDMECATLFTVGFVNYVPMGALMLISDLPLKKGGVKTKSKAKAIFSKYTSQQIHLGINVLKHMIADEKKGFGYQF
ncbi:MAG: AMP nucleosidase [Pseudomonadota bacterium]|nr:AMP nucleosidase [Gammaproteobacteria bacterium]MBU1558380.1 AMP nucleosidase [Gammaproteobacteria bacterium]MBU1629106.1 AMP nucleosidase [Gammaproteobacteria bacterium]MBU1927085.1 AMP nucleosidase [Gammaproteobacteria bacterium]MBU2546473.1 AMP nucleosidase [Gammaproteobacteria bacterium]